MALAVKSLATGAFGSETDLYVAPINKAVIVRNIRLVNSGPDVAKVELFIRRGSGGAMYRIVAKELQINLGAAYIENAELALEGLTASANSDRIRGSLFSGTGPVHFVFSGIERDV